VKIEEMQMDTLRALIQRQLDERKRLERDIVDIDELLRESLGEFHRRVNETPKE
jgi:hypothetical protein